MAKDTFYFSHDYNARTDEKIKKLMRKHGWVGYGVYWALIEDLYQNNNSLELDFDLLSYDYRVDIEVIKSIINDSELFSFDDTSFGSISVSKRLEARNEKSKIATVNAFKRWGKEDSRKTAEDCIFYIIEVYSDEEKFVKCGITSESISRRYSGKLNGYKYIVKYQYDLDTISALKIENEIREKYATYEPKNKFAGYLECFDINSLSDIINFAMQRECKGNAIKERKGNKSKGNKESNKPIFDLTFLDLEMDNMKIYPDQYEKLVKEFGEDTTHRAIKYLSDYKIEKSYKTKNDYLTIRRWVIEAVSKEKNVAPKKESNPKIGGIPMSEFQRLNNIQL